MLGFVCCMRVTQTIHTWSDSLGFIWFKATIKTIFGVVWNRVRTVFNDGVLASFDYRLVRIVAMAINKSWLARISLRFIFLARLMVHNKLIGDVRLDGSVTVGNDCRFRWNTWVITARVFLSRNTFFSLFFPVVPVWCVFEFVLLARIGMNVRIGDCTLLSLLARSSIFKRPASDRFLGFLIRAVYRHGLIKNISVIIVSDCCGLFMGVDVLMSFAD